MKIKKPLDQNSCNPEEDSKTSGVKVLRGDPKKAIVELAIPMVVAMSVQTIYQLVDTY